MKSTPAIQPLPDEPCAQTALPKDFIDPPMELVEPLSESRLIQPLRAAAKTHDPSKILALAAVQFYWAQHPSIDDLTKQGDVALGYALADLAVTGRKSYRRFQQAPILPQSLEEVETVQAMLASSVQATFADVAAALAPALDRVFAVAWALRGPVAQRAALRQPLGWIAVSGEDDMPHRPTNVPAPPFEQYEILVTVRGVPLRTRFFIASPPEGSPIRENPHSLRELPPDPTPHIPVGNQVILFLHGHSSGAE